MQSNWWLNALTGLEIATLVTALALMLAKRLVAGWRSLFGYLTLHLLMRLALVWYLVYPRGHYKPYFWIYWSCSFVLAFLRLGIIGDIVRSFPGLSFLPHFVYWFVAITGFVMAAASWTFCFQHSAHLDVAQDTVVMLNNCTSIAGMTFVVAFLFSVRLFNFGWSPQGARIANGLFLHMAAVMIVAYLLTFKRPVSVRLFANGLDSCSLVFFCSWICWVLRHQPRPEILPEEEDDSLFHWSIASVPLPCSSRER